MRRKVTTESMTGFGSARLRQGRYTYEVEIRSLNHRFFDLSCRLPRGCSRVEVELRKQLGARLGRGKVELSVVRGGGDAESLASIQVNEALARELYNTYMRIAGIEVSASPDVRVAIVSEILRRSEVLTLNESMSSSDEEIELILKAVGHAVDTLLKMRIREGLLLGKDIASRLNKLQQLAKQIKKLIAAAGPSVEKRIRERALKRISTESGVVDAVRIATEVAVQLERADITEELVRFESHIAQFVEALVRPREGRRLDFIAQELGREINTMASKCEHPGVHQLVIDAKVEIEKIREQVQNIV